MCGNLQSEEQGIFINSGLSKSSKIINKFLFDLYF